MSDCCKIYITGSRPKGAHGIQSLALEVPLKSATRARRIVIQNHRVCCKGIIQGVCHPSIVTLLLEATIMQTFLNVGVDVAKDAVVVACAAQSFPAHSITNQRAPLLAWLKSLPAGSRIGLESPGGES